jgi:energy-coupling factor transport system ATP-binding protein
VIEFHGVTFAYPAAPGAPAPRPVLNEVDLALPPGELALVTGPTGAGKSTLLGAVAGLVPHFTGGTLTGRVLVDGRDTADNPPRRLAGLVGYVGQDPMAGFVADLVEDELAYSPEQLGLAPAAIRTRVEEALDLLGLAALRDRDPASLSAGEAQRLAIGAALTAHPRILVLDEPTSALDPAAAEDVMAAIGRLVDDLDMTVLMAEHRLERVIQLADKVVRVHPGGAVDSGPPRSQLADSPVAPPLVRLARALRLEPLPLTVREARRAVRDWAPPGPAPARPFRDRPAGPPCPSNRQDPQRPPPDQEQAPAPTAGAVVLSARGVTVDHPGPVHAVKGVDLDVRAGEVTGLMGRNGAGKTSLLWALARQSAAPGAARRRRRQRRRTPAPLTTLALVPAEPTDLFCAGTVAGELPSAAAGDVLDALAPGIPRDARPRDLSEGQRLALALAVQLTAATTAVALDEPTRGLDYAAKDRLAGLLRGLAAEGRGVLVASHDVEFLAGAADRIVWLAEGRVIADGPARDLLLSVPAHAPQVAKVTAPAAHLTVEAALAALGTAR